MEVFYLSIAEGKGADRVFIRPDFLYHEISISITFVALPGELAHADGGIHPGIAS